MANIAKIIIKDKLSNKLVALKLKEETPLHRVLEVLQKRYPHLQDKENLGFSLKGEQLSSDLTLQQLIEEKNYTEKDRVELGQRETVPPATLQGPQKSDIIAMMTKGGENFDKAILEILVKRQVITRELAESVMQSAEAEKRSFVTTLIEGAYLAEKDVLTTVSHYLAIESVDLEGISISDDLLELIPRDVAEHYCVLPTRKQAEAITLAVVNPFDIATLANLKKVIKLDIFPSLSTERSIRAKIKSLYAKSQVTAKYEKVSPDESPLPDDWFEPNKKQTSKLVIKDGKKVDMDAISSEEYEAQTIWANKSDHDGWEGEGELIQDAEPLTSTTDPHIWDAPTMIAKKTEPVTFSNEEDEDQAQMIDALPMEAADMPGLEEDDGQAEDAIMIEGGGSSDDESGSLFDSLGDDVEGIDMGNFSDSSPIEMEIALGDDEPPAALAISSEDEGMESQSEEPKSDALSLDFDPSAPLMNIDDEQDTDSQIDSLDQPDSQERDESAASDEEMPLPNKTDTLLATAASNSGENLRNLFDDTEGQEEQDETDSSFMRRPSDLAITQKFDRLRSKKIAEPDSENLVLPRTEKMPSQNQSDEAEKQTIPASDFAQTQVFDYADGDKSAIAEEDKSESTKQPPTVSENLELALPGGRPDPDLTDTTTEPKQEPDLDSKPECGPEPKTKPKPEPESGREPEPEPKKKEFAVVPADDAMPDLAAKEGVDTPPVSAVVQPDRDKDEKPVAFPIAIEGAAAPAGSPVAKPAKPRIRKKIARQVAVRYFKKMKSFCTFPLAVLFSAQQVQKIVSEHVEQTDGKAVQVEADSPIIRIVPHFPGCIVVPQETTLDITPEKASAKIWLTPLAEGKIEDGHIQLWYYDRLVQSLAVPTKVVNQKPAKIAAFLGILAPLLSFFLEIYGSRLLAKSDLLQKIAPYLNKLGENVGGTLNLGLIAGGTLLFLAMVLYFARRPREATPIAEMVDFNPSPESVALKIK